MRDTFNKILILVLALLLIGGAVYLLLFTADPEPSQPDDNNNIANDIADEEEFAEPDWHTFINDEVGISFSYPAHFGQVDLNISQGQEGQKFTGSFSDFADLEFGGTTANFTEGREAFFTDVQGFIERDNEFYALYPLGREHPTGNVQTIEAGPLTGIVFRGHDFEDEDDIGMPPDPLHFGSQNLAAVFNLPNENFSGLGFINVNLNQLPPELFVRMLSSLRAH